MTGSHARRRRVVTGVGVALALLGGSGATALPQRHVPRYRYYALYRTDPGAHRIAATVNFTFTHREAYAMEVVLETRNGRHYPFDRTWHGDAAIPYVSAAGHATPGCGTELACRDSWTESSTFYVGIPVWFDYLIATRDGTATADLSQSPDKHWAFKEITGDARVTGRVRAVMPDGVNASAAGFQVQRVGDLSLPGGRYGSVALATAPLDPLFRANTGSAQLDGGQAYMEGVSRLGGTKWHVCGWNLRPTTWRLHGDLTSVGYGGGNALLVYDLPDPKALRALLPGRR